MPSTTGLFGAKRPKSYTIAVTGSQQNLPGCRWLQKKVVDYEFEPSVQVADFGTMSVNPSLENMGCSSGTISTNVLGHIGSGGRAFTNSEQPHQKPSSGGDERFDTPHLLSPGNVPASFSGSLSTTASTSKSNVLGILGESNSRKPGHFSASSNTLMTSSSPSQLPLDSEHSRGSGVQAHIHKIQRRRGHLAIILPDGSLNPRAPLSRTATPALSSHVGSPQQAKDELNNTSSSIQSAMSEPLNRFVQSARKHVASLRPNVGKPFVLPFGKNQQNGPQHKHYDYQLGAPQIYEGEENGEVVHESSRYIRVTQTEDEDFRSSFVSGGRESEMSRMSWQSGPSSGPRVTGRGVTSYMRRDEGSTYNMPGNRLSAAQAMNQGPSQLNRNTTNMRPSRLGEDGTRNSRRAQQSNRISGNFQGVSGSHQLSGGTMNTRNTQSSVIDKAEKRFEEQMSEKNGNKKEKREGDRASWFQQYAEKSGVVVKEDEENKEIWGEKGKPASVDALKENLETAGRESSGEATTSMLLDLANRMGLPDGRSGMRESILQKLRLKACKKLRMKRMRQGRKLKDKNQNRRKAAKPADLDLPAEELSLLKEAFQRYDEDSSGDLDLREVNEAFQDLGLKPKTQDEKIELTKILEELAGEANGGGLIFPEFCQVVQTIRQKIQDAQTSTLFSVFQRFDEDGSGFLDQHETLAILGELQLAPQTQQEEEAVVNVMDDITKNSDHPGQVGFAEFQAMIIKVRETIQGMRRAQEREIRDKFNLDPECFAVFRPELITLYTTFCRVDADGSGNLDLDEVRDLLAQFGLLPKNKEEKEEIDKLLYFCGAGNSEDADAEPEFDFPQYLQLISRLRAKIAADKRDELQEVFMQYDKDHSGDLSMREVSSILVDLGLQPRTRTEQEEIQLMMEEADEDGSESCDFEEFCVLFQRISEKLQAMQREAERRKALELNFSLDILAELRQSFETLDQNGNNALEISEIRRALQLMRKRIPSDTLRELFDEVDVDGSGVLEFQEFLMLMRLIEERGALEDYMPGASIRMSTVQQMTKFTKEERQRNPAEARRTVVDSESQALAQIRKQQDGGGGNSLKPPAQSGKAAGGPQVFVSS